jgi:DNA modification methylase
MNTRTRRPRLINEYVVCDSRKLPLILPDRQFIDVTITSPPYWNVKDYDRARQIGYGQSYEAYIEDLARVFAAVHSRTKRKGSLWLISDTLKLDGELRLLPFDLANRLREVGWKLQDIIIWNKDKTLPWSHQGKMRNIFEYVAFFSKTKSFNYHLNDVRRVDELREWWVRYPERYSPKGKAPTRAWTIPIPRQGSWGNNWVRHFCPLPPELIRRILLLTTKKDDIVFDPFAGSGSVLAQAKAMGRKYVGTDLNADYKKMFLKQVLPAVTKIQRDVNRQSNGTRSQKRIFNRAINALRRTKYPKELIRLYEKEHGKLNVKAVLALKERTSNALQIVFLFSASSRISKKLVGRLEYLCDRAPLSKYGLTAQITALRLGNGSKRTLEQKGLNENTRLYLYSHGRTYAWAGRTSAGPWLADISRNGFNSNGNGYPPILSNVGIKIDPKNPFG